MADQYYLDIVRCLLVFCTLSPGNLGRLFPWGFIVFELAFISFWQDKWMGCYGGQTSSEQGNQPWQLSCTWALGVHANIVNPPHRLTLDNGEIFRGISGSSSLAFDRYRSCIIESMGLSHITTLTTYLNNISTLEVNLEYEVVDKKSKGRPRLHPKKLGLTFLIYHCSIHVVCMHASALSRQVYIWERLIYLLIYPFTFFF